MGIRWELLWYGAEADGDRAQERAAGGWGTQGHCGGGGSRCAASTCSGGKNTRWCQTGDCSWQRCQLMFWEHFSRCDICYCGISPLLLSPWPLGLQRAACPGSCSPGAPCCVWGETWPRSCCPSAADSSCVGLEVALLGLQYSQWGLRVSGELQAHLNPGACAWGTV